MTRHPELPEQDRRILAALVSPATSSREPVSSLWLANRGFGVSSATLRNVMVRLEELGYVTQPHTSAGRVPTDLGYRLYVDQLLAERRSCRPAPRSKPGSGARHGGRSPFSRVPGSFARRIQVGFAIAPATDTTTLEHRFVPRRRQDSRRDCFTGGHVVHKVVETTATTPTASCSRPPTT